MKKQHLKILAFSFLILTKVKAQSPGDIVITEFMPDPAKVTDASGEWFEVYNTSDHAIDMKGWHISDLKTKSHTISNANPLIIQPDGFLLFSIKLDSDANGGITPNYVYSNFTFANASGKIAITDVAGIIIDSVNYTSTSAGKSWNLDPQHFNANENDIPANWCIGSLAYGLGDLGTPQKMNTSCTVTDVPLSNIRTNLNIRTRNGELDILFPNLMEKQQWEIIDITGQTLQSGFIQEATTSFSIMLNKNERGMYFFRLNNSGLTLKFIVE